MKIIRVLLRFGRVFAQWDRSASGSRTGGAEGVCAVALPLQGLRCQDQHALIVEQQPHRATRRPRRAA